MLKRRFGTFVDIYVCISYIIMDSKKQQQLKSDSDSGIRIAHYLLQRNDLKFEIW